MINDNENRSKASQLEFQEHNNEAPVLVHYSVRGHLELQSWVPRSKSLQNTHSDK